jgi:sortase A
VQDVRVATRPAPAADPPRNRIRRTARVVGVAFVVAAVAIGGYVGWTLWGTGFTTQRWQERLRPGLEERIRDAARHPGPPRASTETPPKVPGDAVAILEIPRIDLDMVVVEGTDAASLTRGPGHYTETAYPWQNHGRVAIAGHRTTYLHPFYSLDALRPGDRITLVTEYGTFRYDVTRAYVTAPDGMLPDGSSALHQTRTPTLALTTCHPRYSASERLIVMATRVDAG